MVYGVEGHDLVKELMADCRAEVRVKRDVLLSSVT